MTLRLTVNIDSTVEISVILGVQREASKLGDAVNVSRMSGESTLRRDGRSGDGAASFHCVLVQDDIVKEFVIRMEVSHSAHELVATTSSVMNKVAALYASSEALNSFLVARNFFLNGSERFWFVSKLKSAPAVLRGRLATRL